MAQHDYIISNQTFPNTRADLNNVLQAIATCNKGSSAPTTQYAGQMWIDDSAGTTWTLYLYDGSDNIQVATIDTTANTINFIDSVVSGFDIVTDTTPQLGGDLDTNGNNINFGDDDYANFGASNDLIIGHTGTASLIRDSGTGDLFVDSANLQFRNPSATEIYATMNENGAVSIYYDNSKKLETTSTGVNVTDRLGVGTTSPDTGLQVDSSNYTYSGTNYDVHALFGTSGGGTRIGYDSVDGHSFIGTTGEYNLEFVTYNGSSWGKRVVIDNLGFASFQYGAILPEATLTDGATISWNARSQSVAKVTLGGNRTLSEPSGSIGAGQFISLLVIQDGTGSRTLTWNAVYEFASDTAPTLTTTANKGDLFVFRYNGTKWLEVGRNLNLSLS